MYLPTLTDVFDIILHLTARSVTIPKVISNTGNNNNNGNNNRDIISNNIDNTDTVVRVGK